MSITPVFVMTAALGSSGLGWPARCQAQQPQGPPSSLTVLSEDLQVRPITANVWRHISFTELESFGRSPANGLVVLAGAQAILVDTPWNDAETSTLIDWVSQTLHAHVTAVVVTHSHPDNLGGLAEAHRRGAISYAFDQTVALARAAGREVPQVPVPASYDLVVDTLRLELRHFGAGHTPDNITVWIPQERILFGGCLVRTTSYRTLGWTVEADLERWPVSVERVMQRYASEGPLVVPGHGAPGGLELLTHTLDLLKAQPRTTRGRGEEDRQP